MTRWHRQRWVAGTVVGLVSLAGVAGRAEARRIPRHGAEEKAAPSGGELYR